MHYAVIAAGEGSRLSTEGLQVSKPLVKVCGETLLERLVRIFTHNDATHIYIVCNSRSETLIDYLEQMKVSLYQKQGIPLSYTIADTPSSMHSLAHLVNNTACGTMPFCLTTVDTVFHETAFQRYVRLFQKHITKQTADGLFGITTYIDDESPLYVECGNDGRINAFSDRSNSCKTISAGIYGLTPVTIPVLHRCIEQGESRMRNFQRALIKQGLHIKAFDMGQVIDIDHVSDITKAERMLMTSKHSI